MKIKLVAILALIAIIILAGVGATLLLLSQNETREYSLRFLELQDDTPIEGVEINIHKHLYEKGYYSFNVKNDYIPFTREFVKTVHSDDDGWMYVSLPELSSRRGYYLFELQKDGYISRTGHTILMGLGAKDWWTPEHASDTIYFCSPANVSGIVRDLRGFPVSGVTVCVRYRNVEIDNFDITGSDGSYYIENIRSGSVNLTVSGPGIHTTNVTAVLDKFSDNVLDIVVERSEIPNFNVTVRANIEYGEEPIFVPDNEMALFFIINDRELDVEYCWGGVFLENGNFSVQVPEGNYDLKWYYLGDEEFNRIDVPHLDSEYPANQLTVNSNMEIGIEVKLDIMMDDC